MRALDAPPDAPGRRRPGLLSLEDAGRKDATNEASRDAELGGCLLDGEPLAFRCLGDGRRLPPRRGDQLLGGERVLALEQRPEVVGVDLAPQAHLLGQRADPAPWRLAASEVVGLGRESDLAHVVLGAAGPDASDVQHGTAPGSRRVRRRRNLQVFEGVT